MRFGAIEMTNGINDAPKPSEAIHIPPAALEAGARAAHELMGQHLKDYMGAMGLEARWVPYEKLNPDRRHHLLEEARAAFVAMVEAWPDMAHRVMPYSALILPLMENGNG